MNYIQTPVELPFFVYGTLRPDCYNSGIWRDLGTSTPALAFGLDLFQISGGGFPFVTDGTSIVKGDLIYPHQGCFLEMLRKMDRLEGEGSLYQRLPATVVSRETDENVTAWTYFALSPSLWHGAQYVYSGDWYTVSPRLNRR